jgi:hypothetical protein
MRVRAEIERHRIDLLNSKDEDYPFFYDRMRYLEIISKVLAPES